MSTLSVCFSLSFLVYSVLMTDSIIGQQRYDVIPPLYNSDSDQLQNGEVIQTTPVKRSIRRLGAPSRKLNVKMFLNDYQSFDTISTFMNQLAAKSLLANTMVIGRSYESRDLKVVQITANNDRVMKPIIFVGAGFHGNNFVSTSTAINIAHSLINEYDSKPHVKKLLDAFEFHILPVANPDGYEYARSVDRNWMKNRSNNTNSSQCIGVSMNDNFNVHFGEVGRRVDPCDQLYPGPEPSSETETNAISTYIWKRKDRIKMYLSVYDNGRHWFSPYCYTKKLPSKNFESMVEKSKVAVEAIRKVHNVVYGVGNTCNKALLISGLPSDWAYDIAGIPYSYGISLRHRTFGEATPNTEIKPIAEEIWAGFVAISLELLKEHLKDNLRNLISKCRCMSI